MQPLLNINPFLEVFGNHCEINGVQGFAVVTTSEDLDQLHGRQASGTLYTIKIARGYYGPITEKTEITVGRVRYKVVKPPIEKLDEIQLIAKEI